MFNTESVPQESVTITLNARLQPIHRGELEDALAQVLGAHHIGRISGGGSLLTDNGEIKECDIEIIATDISPQAIEHIISFLERALAPKGSKLRIGNNVTLFGKHEGLALYLNGTDLPDEVYENSDINVIIDELASLLGQEGMMHSHFDGETETALYYYGNQFTTMHQLIEPFLESYPLCQQCRVVQIA
ncbi:hypothetical protein [Budvicia diplopodorum]|uniref:hypothetical protein n=1 Tax=Budvicia diplopodorum TaxID=1119056 RepID=UPI001356CBCA|nr:hypothetical protein [Budvicia diplopodorum]